MLGICELSLCVSAFAPCASPFRLHTSELLALFPHTHFLGTEKVPQRNCVTKILPNIRVSFMVRFASKLGKIQRGAHKRGLKPQIFRENRGEILHGKSGLFGANWRHFRAGRGLFGADRDQFLCTPQPRGKSRNCPEMSMGLSLCMPLGVRAICRACCEVRYRRGSVFDLNSFA